MGTRSPVGFLRAALDALRRDGELTSERIQEIDGLIRHALRALHDPGEAVE